MCTVLEGCRFECLYIVVTLKDFLLTFNASLLLQFFLYMLIYITERSEFGELKWKDTTKTIHG